MIIEHIKEILKDKELCPSVKVEMLQSEGLELEDIVMAALDVCFTSLSTSPLRLPERYDA